MKQKNRARFGQLITIPLFTIIFLTGLGIFSAQAVTVFDDDLLEGVSYVPFANTDGSAVSIDTMVAFAGTASLKFRVPDPGSFLYLGGTLVADQDLDFSGYNALTFYARATYPVTLDLAGFGNDNTGNSLYEAGRRGVALTTDWAFVVVPIPDSSKLISERGLFTIAEGTENAHPEGYDIWIDEMRYANLSNIEVFRPSMSSANRQYFIGSTVAISGTRTIYRMDGTFVPVDHMSGYFDYTTTDAAVAVVEGSAVRVVGMGTATVNAMLLGEYPVQGAITVTGYEAPTVAAAPPTLPASDVISMFSGVYADVPVDTWRTDWSQSDPVEYYVVAGDTTKLYSALIYVGIDFQMHPIDASQMTHLHMDVYAPAGTKFKIKLGSFAVNPGVETTDLLVNAMTTPAFNAGQWSSLDIPLADFQLPAAGWDWAALGLMVLSGDTKLVLVDNVLFHDSSLFSPVVEQSIPLPDLLGAFPNPFNPRTTIAYETVASTRTRLAVYDVAGRLVRVLADGPARANGRQTVVWDGRDERGRAAAAGVYFCRLEAGKYSETKRMALIK